MNYGKEHTNHILENYENGRHQRKSHLQSLAARFLLAILLIFFFGTASLLLGAADQIIRNAPDLSSVSVAPRGYATIMYDADGNTMRTLVQAGSNRKEISYEEIPKNLRNAFIAIEDERFWTHNGIDMKGILRAAAVGLSSGRFSEGASTITQQLIKNNVLDGGTEKNFGDRLTRKIQEQYLALHLEETMSKEEILTHYLNTINLGSNTLGVESAANRYFNKHASELTLSECAVIASITQNPSAYNPITHPDANETRSATVLRRMLDQGMIDRDSYDEALGDNVYERIRTVNENTTTAGAYTYYEDAVIKSVIEDLRERFGYTQAQAYNYLYSGGLRIHTCMNPAVQEAVNEEINDPENYAVVEYSFAYSLHITSADGSSQTVNEASIRAWYEQTYRTDCPTVFDTEEDIQNLIESYKASVVKSTDTLSDEALKTTLQPQASMVIIDNETGYVAAIAGGRGEKTESLSLNRAIDSKRQPGSTFKVLAAFAPAIDTYGATLATTYYDAPLLVEGKQISNWWGSDYIGYANIRQGIVYSMNIVTMKCMVQTVTPAVGYQYVEDFGITTLVNGRQTSSGYYTDMVPALCLGGITDGVTNVELTAAYASIANNGIYRTPIFYTTVTDSTGRVILENEPESHRVIKESTAWLLTNAMQDSFSTQESIWPGTGIYNALGYGFGVDGMSVAAKSGTTSNEKDVWFEGYSPYYTCGIWYGYDDNLSVPSGFPYHKQTWSNVMTRIHEGLSDPGFGTNDDITSAEICSISGLLALEDVCGHGDDPGYVYTEYFVKGSEPTEYCSRHVMLKICESSEMLAAAFCPEDETEDVIFVKISEADEEENPGLMLKNTPNLLISGVTDQICTQHEEAETEEETEEETKDSESEADTDETDTEETSSDNNVN